MGPEENGEQGDQKQKEQQGSGLDSRAIDYINRARRSQETQDAKTGGRLAGKAGKKAAGKAGKRMAAQAGKQVGKMAVRAGAQAAVAAGQTLVSTAPAWGIPALILFIIIIVVIIIFGGGQNVKAGNPQDCTTIGGTCSSQPTCSDVPDSQPDTTSICSDTSKPTCCVAKSILDCTPANAAKSLKDGLNIVVTGAANNDQISTICKIYSKVIVSPLYKQLLTCGGNQLTIALVNTSGSISLGGPNLIQLNGFFASGKNDASRENLLIHESGHVMKNRNCLRVSQQYENDYSNLVSSDGACYNLGYVRSYPLRLGTFRCNPGLITGITSTSESFAEQIADYVTYKYFTNPTGFRCSQSLQSVYMSVCSNTYTWVRSNIFGGTEF